MDMFGIQIAQLFLILIRYKKLLTHANLLLPRRGEEYSKIMVRYIVFRNIFRICSHKAYTNETWYVRNSQGRATVPEPASVLHLGGGLAECRKKLKEIFLF